MVIPQYAHLVKDAIVVVEEPQRASFDRQETQVAVEPHATISRTA
jgi:hypothetical protein